MRNLKQPKMETAALGLVIGAQVLAQRQAQTQALQVRMEVQPGNWWPDGEVEHDGSREAVVALWAD